MKNKSNLVVESTEDEELTTRDFHSASLKGANQNWVYDSDAVNENIRQQREIIVARSRDLDDNHSLATGANDTLTHKILAGTGLRIKVECEDEAKRDEITTLLEESFESNQLDFDQLNDFYSLVEMLVRTTLISGECIAVLNWIDDEDCDTELLGFNMKILEPEFLDSTKTNTESGNIIVDGIEFDDDGKRVAYHLYPVNPDACIKLGRDSKRYPVAQVIHSYFQRRAGQLRGIPKAQSSFNTLKLLSDWEDSTAQRQRNTSALSVFVEDQELGYQSPFINNNDINAGASDSSITDNAAKLHDVLKKIQGNENPKPEIPEIPKKEENPAEKFLVSNRPGAVSILPPGKRVKIVEHKGIDGFEAFNTHLLHRIAKGWGLSYEALTGDVSRIKFASGRISRLDMADELNHARRVLLKNKIAPKIIKYITEVSTEISD